MEGYRPAFDSDTELADVEIAEATSADAEPARRARKPAPIQTECFDPVQFPLTEPYSLDGITAIHADVFGRSRHPR